MINMVIDKAYYPYSLFSKSQRFTHYSRYSQFKCNFPDKIGYGIQIFVNLIKGSNFLWSEIVRDRILFQPSSCSLILQLNKILIPVYIYQHFMCTFTWTEKLSVSSESEGCCRFQSTLKHVQLLC